MKLFKKMKDGGAESNACGYWLVEIKGLFSIVLLRFNGNSREAYHTHAFNAISWLLRGKLKEEIYNGGTNEYTPGLCPIFTRRKRFHKVSSQGVSWTLSFRGPWNPQWREYREREEKFVDLTHGRREIQNTMGVGKQ